MREGSEGMELYIVASWNHTFKTPNRNDKGSVTERASRSNRANKETHTGTSSNQVETTEKITGTQSCWTVLLEFPKWIFGAEQRVGYTDGL